MAREIKPVFHGKPIRWTKKQASLVNAPQENVCAFGAWGWGKTTALWWRGLTQSMDMPGGWGLIGTDTGPNLTKIVDQKIIPLTPPELILKHEVAKKRIITQTYDGVPFTWQCVPYLEWEKLGGPDINIILGDEMSRCGVKSHRALVARLRHPASNKHYLSYATNNKGKDWMYQEFVKGNLRNTRQNYYWVQGSTFENLHNLPKNYLQRFRNYPDRWWRRFILGEFCEFTGVVFEVNEKTHVIPDMRFIPKHWTVQYIIDHGFGHPTVCLLFAVDPQGRHIVIKEYHRRGRLPGENAKNIAEMLKPYRYHGVGLYGYGCPSMWHKHGGTAPMSAFTTEFQKHDITCPRSAYRKTGKGSREMKLQSVFETQTLLEETLERAHPITGASPAPTLYVCEGCINTLESLEKINWVEDAPDGGERIEKVDGDDEADCVRYHSMNPIEIPEASGKPQDLTQEQKALRQLETREARIRKAYYDSQRQNPLEIDRMREEEANFRNHENQQAAIRGEAPPVNWYEPVGLN